MSQNKIKTKKCQSYAGDRPDLIQTAPVPSIGLARQNKNKQNVKTENATNSTDVTLVKPHELKMSQMSQNKIKTKKCQSYAGDRPDLIQTAPVPSIGLACQNKNKQNVKTENATNSTDVTLVKSHELKIKSVYIDQPDDKWIMVESIKTKKCQPAVRDTLEKGHTLRSVGSAGWHAQKIKINRTKK